MLAQIKSVIQGLCFFNVLSLVFLTAYLTQSSKGEANPLKYCKEAPPEVQRLRRLLQYSETPKQWRAIYRESEQQRNTLLKRQMFTTYDEGCLNLISAESAFYLSDQLHEKILWSTRAIGHLLNAQHWFPKLQRDSRIMTRTLTLRKRLKKAFTLFKKQTSVPFDWLSLKESYTLKLPMFNRPITLTLSPSNPVMWSKVCGLSKACQKVVKWRFHITPNTPLSLKIPAGTYRVTWSGRCAKKEEVLHLRSQKTSLIAPKLKCTSALTIKDLFDGEAVNPLYVTNQKKEPINPAQAPEGEQLLISSPGYLSQTITVPKQGRPLQLSLRRCHAPVTWEVTPKTAQIKAPPQIYWGQTLMVRASHIGYEPVERVIETPRPKQCPPSPVHVKLTLTRSIAIYAQNNKGLKIPLNSLSVSGLKLDHRSSLFYRPPGTYRVDAYAENFKPLSFRLTVDPCGSSSPSKIQKGDSLESAEYKPRCEDAQLRLNFSPKDSSEISPERLLRNTGFVFTSIGVFLSIYAYQGGLRYEELKWGDHLSDQRDSVQQMIGWSTGFLMGGLSMYLLSKMWPALSSESTPNPKR